MSICEATTLERILHPSATTAAAVSSQDDSMPRMRKLTQATPEILSNWFHDDWKL
jgi:hypothetical protein